MGSRRVPIEPNQGYDFYSYNKLVICYALDTQKKSIGLPLDRPFSSEASRTSRQCNGRLRKSNGWIMNGECVERKSSDE